jgi:hypothetical protein
MVAGLGSLTSSPPLTFKMWSKISIPVAEEGAMSAVAEEAMSAVAEEERVQQAPQQTPEEEAVEGTMSVVAEEEEGVQQAPQQTPEEEAMSAVAEEERVQQAPQQTPEEEEAMSVVAEEGAKEAAEAALRRLRRQCFLPVSTHEPTPQALLAKKVSTRRPLPPVGNVLRL